MALSIITPPTTYPVTVAELKKHLRLEQAPFTEEDAFVEDCLKEAIKDLDGPSGALIGRCLEQQEWLLTVDHFPCGSDPMLIPIGPVISVDQIDYDDAAGVAQVLSPSSYELDIVSLEQWIAPNINVLWPITHDSMNAVRVSFTAGYARTGTPPDDVSTVPEPIRKLIKDIAQYNYDRKADGWKEGILAAIDRWRWTRV